jgi:ABC-type lipoprotein release transport system permease subunit
MESVTLGLAGGALAVGVAWAGLRLLVATGPANLPRMTEIALSVIGIYGVIAYAVSQRRREIGIRLALGAPKQQLSWMFVRSALLTVAAGMVIGTCAAALLTRLMQSLLFGISALDPVTYVTVPLVLAAAALMAARRAAGVDPMEALRAEEDWPSRHKRLRAY